MPHLSSPPMTWRNQRNRYMLLGSYCSSCEKTFYPPTRICSCGSKTDEKRLPRTGKVLTYTTINAAPTGFDSPYNIAIIQLDNGPKITGIVINNGKRLSIGSVVKTIFRKLFTSDPSDVIQYTMKFEVVE